MPDQPQPIPSSAGKEPYSVRQGWFARFLERWSDELGLAILAAALGNGYFHHPWTALLGFLAAAVLLVSRPGRLGNMAKRGLLLAGGALLVTGTIAVTIGLLMLPLCAIPFIIGANQPHIKLNYWGAGLLVLYYVVLSIYRIPSRLNDLRDWFVKNIETRVERLKDPS
jgi:hypothetical protein